MDRLRISVVFLSMIAGFSLIGCQSAKPPAPDAEPNASTSSHADEMKMVADGKNKELSYKAPQYGKIYLFDVDSGQFIFRGAIAAGEKFTFEPASSRAQIDKQTIDLERGTNDKDEYRLYYVPL